MSNFGTDLFSAFNEDASEDLLASVGTKRDRQDAGSTSDQQGKTLTKNQKRKLHKQAKKEARKAENGTQNHSNEDQSIPLVADSFETEASREVDYSAGLQAQSASEAEHKVKLSHQIRHQVALPKDYDYVSLSTHVVKDPARTYPFTLDPFQDAAVKSIDRNESVLVSAHTSAGKTVVAEYAIAQALREKQRVIYTSPIKALSNQKYRELNDCFGDVGLMTGDVTINPNAGCLVMTTEILRSMLYKGSEVMREVSWVIFDEIHYMRDRERGVVWEEAIILLPDKVRFVFLSATIPNAMQFAEWICKIHNQPCHIVYTDFRPTPLQHYLFPAGSDGIFLVVDEKGTFREENFQKAMGLISAKAGDDPAGLPSKRSKKGKTYKGGNSNQPSDIYKIIKLIMTRKYDPVIVFSFSKRECEALALKMSKLDFNNEEEHEMVTKVFMNAISQLSDDDRELPQIRHILVLLRRGIGIHHSGMLPILKEVIEILFQEGYIKVLFATETFSIGLNMPAKTVVFTSVQKFDGKELRWVSGGEYIQMSGRAGRRGLDDRGIVIMMVDSQMEPSVAKGMVKGQADRLDSAFHLTYNMILNLLRVGGISSEFMLERCFYQFQKITEVPQLEAEKETLAKEIEATKVESEAEIRNYYELKSKMESYDNDMRKIVIHPGNSLKFLQPGRLLKIKVGEKDFGWCALIKYFKRPTNPRNPEYPPMEAYFLDVLVWVPVATPPVDVPKDLVSGKAEIFPVVLDSVVAISKVRIQMPKEVKSPVHKSLAWKAVKKALDNYTEGIPLLDPVENMNIDDPELKTILSRKAALKERLDANPLAHSPELSRIYDDFLKKVALEKKYESILTSLKETKSIIQLEELKKRNRVLRQLEFTTDNEIIELKGRVACEINAGDELVLTELIFNGMFNDLTPEQCAALLSCFVFDEKVKDAPRLPAELSEPLRLLQETARKVAKVEIECRLETIENEYVDSFHSELMDVVYSWCKGATFSQICKMTEVYEGSLIRVFRRMEELVNQMIEAAKVIGSADLQSKMEEVLRLSKRDLVSAGSLYI
ncbi:hypothetical protein CANCADRAFT_58742 [Tortispora caseinolytica NRRL Y-17796]|uniref:ATP-dependent RNA helicase DOB1 n=1 Tax=Tortispora caseinolytica NRRL Y-17796 TaxID=767744 RepID=A0A1E4T9N9_9ASCO|nr:hypothetical protein CANCADRAFT_58742 [Tortispora caseinolytica NRRL Y-17796]